MSKCTLTLVMPALNEEANILAAIHATLLALDGYGIVGEVVVVDDGSTDRTGEVVSQAMLTDSRIRMIRHERPQGIGAAFWDGVAAASGELVCMMPGDYELEPSEIIRYCTLMDDVDFVVPYVFDKRDRTPLRRILSIVYSLIVGVSFGVSFKYTNGTVIYRKLVLDEVEYHSPGFFFQADILVRMAKRGYLCAEVPYWICRRVHGASKALSWRSLRSVVAGYLRLFFDIYLRRKKPPRGFVQGSQTATRYAESRKAAQKSEGSSISELAADQ